MTSLRHLALGCCVLSALAGMVRLFWPDNSFKPVINAVLALYIITAGVQMVRGLDWAGVAQELRSLPTDAQDLPDYSSYRRELALTASVEAVREVLQSAGINAAGRMAYVSSRRWISATNLPSKPCLPSMRALCRGALQEKSHDRPGVLGPAGGKAARCAGG